MSLLAKKPEGDFSFELPPQGNHIAVCFSVVDLGLQESIYQGVSSMKHKVRVTWELTSELMQEGEFAGSPFSISKNYTLSLHEKSVLYSDLVSWRGRSFSSKELEGFDLFNILGAPCMLNVVHEQSADGQKTYANVKGVTPMPKGMPAPTPINEKRKFSIAEHTQEEFNSLPDWLKEKINMSMPKPTEDEYFQTQPTPDCDQPIPGF